MEVARAFDEKEQLVKKYIPLVKYIASRIILGKSKYIDYDDLLSCGMVGLIDAINKFDSMKGMKFSTYASIRIKGSMIDEIRKNSPISKGAMDKLNAYNGAVEELQKKLLREPTYEEIAKYMNITENEVWEIEANINYIAQTSLESILFSDDDEIELKGIVEDKNSPSPERILEEKEEVEHLAKALESLKEKDRLVLTLYYYERMTLKDIGKVLQVSESRVSQLHSRAIMRLRKAMQDLKYSKG
ncbi:MAG: FliA/WhiG family RNA polymerase sigma factor [Clostridiales bacterium]|nr:FliA/WhiG family RNA polymerase sigma factor [Clostridiales bacterium]